MAQQSGTEALRRAAGTASPTTALAERPDDAASLSKFLEKFKPQMALALPQQLTPDRMARLVVTQFSKTPTLYKCEPHTVAGAVMTACTLGLEIGVQGQGFLVPYFNQRKNRHECQFIPGWRGLVDLVNRAGRATVWTGAVFAGDDFDYSIGSKPFIEHKPGDEDDPAKITHVYAVGWVNGAQWPNVDVWKVAKVRKHRDRYNKVGEQHYSFREWEMYARKVPLLQVLKYMPSSIELQRAMDVAAATEQGVRATMDMSGVIDLEEPDPSGAPAGGAGGDASAGKASSKGKAAPKAAAAPSPAESSGAPIRTYAQLEQDIQKASSTDELAEVLDLARSCVDAEGFAKLQALAQAKGGKA